MKYLNVLLIISFLIAKITASEYFNTSIKGDFNVVGCNHRVPELKVPSKVVFCVSGIYVFYDCENQEKSGFLYGDKVVCDDKSEHVACQPYIELLLAK